MIFVFVSTNYVQYSFKLFYLLISDGNEDNVILIDMQSLSHDMMVNNITALNMP